MRVPPHVAGSAGLERGASLFIPGQLVERNSDHFHPQAGEQHGGPIRMIPDVDRINLAFPAFTHRRLKTARLFFDLSKALGDIPACIEDGRQVAFAGQRRIPREEQYVGRFHCLRGGMSAPTFATRF